jgi:hypothetical protein
LEKIGAVRHGEVEVMPNVALVPARYFKIRLMQRLQVSVSASDDHQKMSGVSTQRPPVQ